MFLYRYPGTSYLATIVLSRRDITHSLAEALLKLTLMGWPSDTGWKMYRRMGVSAYRRIWPEDVSYSDGARRRSVSHSYGAYRQFLSCNVLVLLLVLILIVGPKLFIEPGSKALSNAFERERPRIVNNFAASASPRLRMLVLFTGMNESRLSNLAIVLESATNTQIRTNRRRRLRLAISNSLSTWAARTPVKRTRI